jgi:DnaK suppressor protein
MLSSEERAELRELLRERIVEAEGLIADLRERTKPIEPDSAIGRVTRMDSILNAGTSELTMQQTRQLLERLRDKLRRVDHPDFGKCGLCGQWIEMERLRSMPDRAICRDCVRSQR